MSRVYECDGCGKRLDSLDRACVHLSGHLRAGPERGVHLGGEYHFCGYGCIEKWAGLRKLGPKS